MLISELEAKLKLIREQHGDCEVCINTNYDVLWKRIDRIEHVITEGYYATPYKENKVFLC